MSLTLKQIEKLEQLREQSDANGGRDKATGSNFILYGLYRTAVMDAAPELIAAARENAALHSRIRDLSGAEARGRVAGLREAIEEVKREAIDVELQALPFGERGKHDSQHIINHLEGLREKLEQRAAEGEIK